MMMMSGVANGKMRMRSPTLLIQGHMLEDRFVIIIITMFAISIMNIIITFGHMPEERFVITISIFIMVVILTVTDPDHSISCARVILMIRLLIKIRR